MGLLLNGDERQLRDAAQDFLAGQSGVAALRSLRAEPGARGYDEALWRGMAEMGWPAMLLPAAYGGLDFGFKGMGALFEQGGRRLCVSPLLASVVLGGGLLLRAGSEAQRQAWLPGIASGAALFALALDETPRHDPRQVRTRASPCGEAGGWRLDGEKWLVLDGHVADRLVVAARSAGEAGAEHGVSLFLVDPASPGVRIERTVMIDSRNAARVCFDGVQLPADALLGTRDRGFADLDAVLDQARICLAAEAMGIMREAFERTLDYLKQRVQFDVPLASFQALQHRMARLHVRLELCASAVAAALAAHTGGGDGAAGADGALEKPLLASLAKAMTADLSETLLNEAVQLHGGIGVTDELDIGLFLKRARVIQQTFGDGLFHRERYARLKGF
jgi:alkylation response protein AidB-like acyl-CoA dehydrogenase